MRHSTPSLALIAFLPPLALSIVPTCGGGACGSGGGGGGSNKVELEREPNDQLLLAHVIQLDRPVKGDVIEPEDVDWFQLRLKGGRTVKVELFATRLDQATWDATGTVPRLSIYFPDDQTIFHEHSLATGWPYGTLDFDIPAFTVPQNGTYWFVIRADTDLSPGGRYVLRVSYTTPNPNQQELETQLDIGIDDTPGTAQLIQAGTLTGFHRNGNDDFYKVVVGNPRVLRAEIFAQRNGIFGDATTPYDPILRLVDVDGSTILAETDDVFFGDPAIQHYVGTPGTYYFQVTQNPASAEDGPYVLTFRSDSGSATAETEPNDTTGAADSIEFGSPVSGTIAPGTVDWFRLQADPGDMLRLQYFDAANSTAATEAIDVGLFEADGTTPVQFHVGPAFQVLTTILQQNGPYFVRVLPNAMAAGPTPYRLELTRFHGTTRESEPNDSLVTATPFPNSRFVSGAITSPGDRDLYRFTTSNDELVTFVVYAGSFSTGSDGFSEYSDFGSALDPLLIVRDSLGAIVATSTSQPANGTFTESVLDGLPTAAVTFVAPVTGHVFYLEVADADGSGSAAHYYAVERR
jgi:hypothetical protein